MIYTNNNINKEYFALSKYLWTFGCNCRNIALKLMFSLFKFILIVVVFTIELIPNILAWFFIGIFKDYSAKKKHYISSGGATTVKIYRKKSKQNRKTDTNRAKQSGKQERKSILTKRFLTYSFLLFGAINIYALFFENQNFILFWGSLFGIMLKIYLAIVWMFEYLFNLL